jgi:segregation and condensation protein B
MQELKASIEAILFVTAEPQRIDVLAKRLDTSEEMVQEALKSLEQSYDSHAMMLLVHDDAATLVTRPEHSSLIETMRKEELSKELTKASAETLAIVLYSPGVSKAEIEFIRGVNASYTIRNLMMRGLIESKGAGRAIGYYPTMNVLEQFGISSIENLPQYSEIKQKLDGLMKQEG